MAWDFQGMAKDEGFIQTVEPVEVLDEIDGPMLFTALSADGSLVLVYYSDQGEGYRATRYIIAPTTRQTVGALKGGHCSIREALDQPQIWVVDTVWEDLPQPIEKVEVCWRGCLGDVPEGYLPDVGAMIFLEHQS